jgi:hypothetical protein
MYPNKDPADLNQDSTPPNLLRCKDNQQEDLISYYQNNNQDSNNQSNKL